MRENGDGVLQLSTRFVAIARGLSVAFGWPHQRRAIFLITDRKLCEFACVCMVLPINGDFSHLF